MEYLTLADYKSLGGTLEQPEFIRQEYAVRKEIDLHTFNRLQAVDPIPQDLKMCTFELIQRQLCGDLDGQDFSSQGSGNLSGTKEDRQKRICEIIRRYLDGLSVGGIPVFYAGNV
jgi:hypothetical protein